jgi:hypothetical protein
LGRKHVSTTATYVHASNDAGLAAVTRASLCGALGGGKTGLLGGTGQKQGCDGGDLSPRPEPWLGPSRSKPLLEANEARRAE